MDPHAGYRAGLLTGFAERTERGLDAPAVVVDHFHAIKLANAAIDDVRRRRQQQQTLGHRGRKPDPLYGIRRVLLRGAERLGPCAWERLLAGLDAGDPGQQAGRAWIAKEQLRKTYAADLDQARRRLTVFYTHVADAAVPELIRLATTISLWEEEILAYFTTDHASNGRTEAANLLIKRIKRVGFSFRNFDNYRLRRLLP